MLIRGVSVASSVTRGIPRVSRENRVASSTVPPSLSLSLSLSLSFTVSLYPLVVRLSLAEGWLVPRARKRTLKNVIARSPGIVGRENGDAGPLYFPHYSNINVNVDTNG